jgi:hypothetical protein
MIYAGLIFSGEGGTEIRLIYVPLTWYFLMMVIPQSIGRLQVLDPLPISRRRIFAMMVGAGFIALGLGYTAGKIILSVREEPRSSVFLAEKDGAHQVLIPPEEFTIAWDGNPPALESPWGETHPATTVPIFKGLAPALYKPFETPAGSSVDFVAWQLGRALAELHGQEVDYRELRDRFLAAGPDGSVQLRREDWRVGDDFPDLTDRSWLAGLPWSVLVVVLPWLLLVALLLRAYRYPFGVGRRRVAVVGVFAVALGLYILPVILAIAGLIEPWAWSGFAEILARRAAEALPGGTVAVWPLVVLALWGAYRLAEARFLRVEIAAAADAKEGR